MTRVERTLASLEKARKIKKGGYELGCKEIDAIYKASHYDKFDLAFNMFNMFNIGFMRGIRYGKAMAKKQIKEGGA